MSIVPLMRCSCPVPLAEKHPQSIMFPPPCLRSSWGHRQHSSSSKHDELSWCQRAGFCSHRTTTLSPSSPLNHWQTSDRPVLCFCWAGGPRGRCRISVLHSTSLHLYIKNKNPISLWKKLFDSLKNICLLNYVIALQGKWVTQCTMKTYLRIMPSFPRPRWVTGSASPYSCRNMK